MTKYADIANRQQHIDNMTSREISERWIVARNWSSYMWIKGTSKRKSNYNKIINISWKLNEQEKEVV